MTSSTLSVGLYSGFLLVERCSGNKKEGETAYALLLSASPISRFSAPPCLKKKFGKGHDPNPWFSGIIFLSGLTRWRAQFKNRA